MKTRTIIAAALLAGTGLTGGSVATASSDTGAERRAATDARDAGRALKKHRAAKAVAAAESAVALQPRNAGYRTLLGQAYLAAGRFPSAAGALSDALSLDPSDGVAALHLTLAQIATGEWAAARQTLSTHETRIAASDRGLALALAGDPATAVTILTDAARLPGADAKTRQNLALSLALAGRWQEAKTVAAFDTNPEDLDARIMQWASFARPVGAADQVAALLGVVPIEDGGQPERLALRSAAPSYAAVAQPVSPVDAFMPGRQATSPTAPAASAEVTFTGVVAPAPEEDTARRDDVVQPVPARTSPGVKAARKPVSVRARPAAPARAARGNFYVQLGAFGNAGVAQAAWHRLSRRHAGLAAYAPSGMRFSMGGATYYRLSVGGFARADADGMCRRVRANGGKCFVRSGAGDTVASWSKGVQLASR